MIRHYVATMKGMQLRIVAAVAALGLLVAACSAGGSSTQSITDAQSLTRIDIPADWEYYSSDAMSGLAGTPFVAEADGLEMPIIARFAFDANPVPVPENLLVPSLANFPVGSSVVRRITPQARDHINRYLLAEVVVPYHSASANEELLKQDIDLGDDFQGVQVGVVYKEPSTDADTGVLLISATDPEVTMLFQVAIGCSFECFQTYQADIRAVIDTWLVNTRG